MASVGHLDRAQSLFELLAEDPNADIRNEARFRHALLLEAKGQERLAAVLLRRILDDRPDTAAVRLKLATLLQRMGDESAALRELRALRTTDLPPNTARFVDRLSASLQATKPLGFQVEVALAPDSNINRATRSEALGTVFGDFKFDKGSKARPGVGAALRGFAQARHAFADNFAVAARAGTEANLYRDKNFNDITLDFAGGPELRLGRTRLSLEGGISHQWYGMKPYNRGLRLGGSITHPVNGVSQVRFDASARWANNQVNDLQDGNGVSARARYERALSLSLLVTAHAALTGSKPPITLILRGPGMLGSLHIRN